MRVQTIVVPVAVLVAIVTPLALPTVMAEHLYPSIYEFRNPGSDRFIVDFKDVRDGHPFLGLDVNTSITDPHQGIHVYFHNDQYVNTNIADYSLYPPIYALADMEITTVDFTYVSSSNGARHIKVTGKMATSESQSQCYQNIGGNIVTAGYSIEPFVPQSDETLYHPFVRVSVGDMVKKGDVIAYMYLPPDTTTVNSHIHFNLNVYRYGQSSGIRAPPDVWNSTVVNLFYQQCQNYTGGDRHWKNYGDCIAVDLVANESLYGEGPSTCVPDSATRAAAPVANPVIVVNGCVTTTTTTSAATTTTAGGGTNAASFAGGGGGTSGTSTAAASTTTAAAGSATFSPDDSGSGAQSSFSAAASAASLLLVTTAFVL